MTLSAWTLFPILGFLALQPAPSVTSAPAPAGHWEGTIQAPGQELAIEVDLARPADVWQGQITIPAQHIKGLPLTGVAAEAGAVTFGMKSIPGDPRFKGTVGKDSKTMTGEFSQGGITMPFTLTWKGEARLETPPKNGPITKELEGIVGRHSECRQCDAATRVEAVECERIGDRHAHQSRPGRR